MMKQNNILDTSAKITSRVLGVLFCGGALLFLCARTCVGGALLPTYSQQGLVVVDVFGGKGWTHADGKWWQRQTRQQAGQQELQLDLLLIG